MNKNTNRPEEAEEDIPEISFDGYDFISDEIYSNLPELLRKVISPFNDDKRDRDLVLISSIVSISACFPKIEGNYHGSKVRANLYAIILAPPASGKGFAKYAVQIANELHKSLKNTGYKNEAGEIDLSKIATDKNELQLHRKRLYLSANSSTAALLEEMKSNQDFGNLMFDSELDIASSVSKQEWGQMFSEMLRKSFHHERLSVSRKGDGYYEIENPNLSILFTGTPNQLGGFIRSVADGLFSRFIFYRFDAKPVWKDVGPSGARGSLENYFEELSKEYFSIFNFYLQNEFAFNLTKRQWQQLNSNFHQYLLALDAEFGQQSHGIAKRMGLILYRVGLILSALRSFDSEIVDRVIVCTDEDFKLALELCKTFLYHSTQVFGEIQRYNHRRETEQKEKFYEGLPTGEFRRSDAILVGVKTGMGIKTIDNTLKEWIGTRLKYPRTGFYEKG